MSRLTRDGTAEPVSRDQILRHARGQGNIIFPVQLTTSRIGSLTRLIHTLLYVMTIHTVASRFSLYVDHRKVTFSRGADAHQPVFNSKCFELVSDKQTVGSRQHQNGILSTR